mgnify:CR=1 FL=1
MATVLTDRHATSAGRRVRIHRINRGMSPEQFGHRVGVSGQTIRRIENGKRPTIRTMFLVARELDCEVVDLWPPE